MKCYGKYGLKDKCKTCQFRDYCEASTVTDKRRHDLMGLNEAITADATPTEIVPAEVLAAQEIAGFFLQLRQPKDIIIALLISAGYSMRKIEAITMLPASTVNSTARKLKDNENMKVIFEYYNRDNKAS